MTLHSPGTCPVQVPRQGKYIHRCAATRRNGLLRLSNLFHFACIRSVVSCVIVAQLTVCVPYVHHSNVTMVMMVSLTSHTIYYTVSPRLHTMLDVLHKGQKISKSDNKAAMPTSPVCKYCTCMHTYLQHALGAQSGETAYHHASLSNISGEEVTLGMSHENAGIRPS